MSRAGERIGPVSTLVDARSMPVWARALRDPNPIHVDPGAAKAAGLGDTVINQGPANIGYMLGALLRRFPDATIERMEFRFLDNVKAGDVAVASGAVVSEESLPSGRRLNCELTLSVSGRPVLTGTASVTVPR
jgi:acyl dehydratase